LIFSDYMRSSIRLAAIMELPSIFVFTHDSIGVGEDGPTHQPIEHMISLRAIPGLITLRPGDANEVAEAWRVIMEIKHQPVCLILSRQNMPTLDRTSYAPASGVAKGAYVLADSEGAKPEIILMATGTEVGLAIDAYEKLSAEGLKARVVSMPSWELFEQQPESYRESVLPHEVKARMSVEQAGFFGWAYYTGLGAPGVGMRTFGASAPLKELQKKFGFTPEKVVETAKEIIARTR
jgi:transketolase